MEGTIEDAVSAALNHARYKDLLELSGQKKSKPAYSFEKILKKYPYDKLIALSKQVFALITKMYDEIKEKTGKADSNILKTDFQTTQGVIKASIDISTAILQILPDDPQCLKFAVFLNGVIFQIPNDMEGLKSVIVQACEKLKVLKCFPDSVQYYTFNAVLYLLECASERGQKNFVKRAYSMHETILLLPTMDEVNKSQMWNIFKKCLKSPGILTTNEGQKIIKIIFQMDKDQVPSLHKEVKQLLRSCNSQLSSIYGKIYFDVWEHAALNDLEELKTTYEMHCILGIIHQALNEMKISQVQVYRKFLAQFHIRKQEKHVAKMMWRLYYSVLWVSLGSSEPLVRANACQLFLDVFPLENPEYSKPDASSLFSTDTLRIKELLVDKVPYVRLCALTGACVVMSLNWELFSEEILKEFLKIIVNNLSCDSTTPRIRGAVAKGVKILLANPQTLPTLSVVLPKLKNLFHDISESVRLSFCDLLLQVKRISNIKYYDIVPYDHLLARLAEDSDAVAKAIVNLIHNNYFPKSATDSVRVEKVTILILNTPNASRVFFRHVSTFIQLKTAVYFIVHALSAIHIHVKSKMSGKSTAVILDEYPESKPELKEFVTAVDEHSNLPRGLIDVSIVMWLALLRELEKPENKSWTKYLVRKLQGCIEDISLFYKRTPVWKSVCYLTTFLPQTSSLNVTDFSLCNLYELDNTSSPQNYYHLVLSLCENGQSSKVLSLIKKCLDEEVTQPSLQPETGKRKRKTAASPKCYLGIGMLKVVLNSSSCQKIVLSQHADFLTELMNEESYVKFIKKMIENENYIKQKGQFLKELLFLLLQISFHLRSQDEHDSVRFIGLVTGWLKSKLKVISQRSRSLILLLSSMVEDVFSVAADMTLLRVLDDNDYSILNFGKEILSFVSGPFIVLGFSKFLHKRLAQAHCLAESGVDNSLVPKLLTCFYSLISCLKDERFFLNIPKEAVSEIEAHLSDFVNLMHSFRNMPEEIVYEVGMNVVKSCIERVLKIVSQAHISKELLCVSPKRPSNDPWILLVRILIYDYKNTKRALKYFHDFYTHSAADLHTTMAYCFVIKGILHSANLGNIAYTRYLDIIQIIMQAMQNAVAAEKCKERVLDEARHSFLEQCKLEFEELKKLGRAFGILIDEENRSGSDN